MFNFTKNISALISLIDLFTRSVLNGSPSSTIRALLITESFVTELPTIFILSIITFSPSKILSRDSEIRLQKSFQILYLLPALILKVKMKPSPSKHTQRRLMLTSTS